MNYDHASQEILTAQEILTKLRENANVNYGSNLQCITGQFSIKNVDKFISILNAFKQINNHVKYQSPMYIGILHHMLMNDIDISIEITQTDINELNTKIHKENIFYSVSFYKTEIDNSLAVNIRPDGGFFAYTVFLFPTGDVGTMYIGHETVIYVTFDGKTYTIEPAQEDFNADPEDVI